MKKLHFTIRIAAPRQVVWDTMLQPETYSKWTAAFCDGSYYKGSWETGSDILFLSPSGEGMKAVIAENRPGEFISIRHFGCVSNENVEPITEPAFENYAFRDVEGGTELSVEMDSPDQYEAMFQDMWPRALQLLKALCESNRS